MDIKDAICAFSVLFYDRLLRYRGDPRGYVTDHLWPRAAGIKGSYHLIVACREGRKTTNAVVSLFVMACHGSTSCKHPC